MITFNIGIDGGSVEVTINTNSVAEGIEELKQILEDAIDDVEVTDADAIPYSIQSLSIAEIIEYEALDEDEQERVIELMDEDDLTLENAISEL